MADAVFQPYPDSTGKMFDLTSLTVSAQTVYRQRYNIADPTSATALAAVVAKGSQGAFALATQDLVDSGRVNIQWTAELAATAVSEALVTLTESRDAATATTFTTKVITSGKRLRIQSVSLCVESGGSTGTALQRAILRCRLNTAGAATTSSPLQGVWQVGTTTATLKSCAWGDFEFPSGMEFLGDGTKQLGFTLTNPDWITTTMIPTTRVTINAFEY